MTRPKAARKLAPKTATRSAVLLGLCLVAALTGCTAPAADAPAHETSAEEQAALEELSADEDSSAAARDFAARLLSRCVDEDPDRSTLVSPLSTLYALALLENGAEGETLAQLEEATGITCEELTSYLSAYAVLAAEGPLELANSVWLRDDDGLKVSDDFLEVCEQELGAQAFLEPFDDGTAEAINSWVSEGTHGMIPSIVDHVSESAMLYLVNALAFEGVWEEPYEDAFVQDDTFTCEDGAVKDVQMMLSSEDAYYESDLATGFSRPYEGGYSFVALLPREGVTAAELVASLDGKTLDELLTPVANTVVDAHLPKFTNTYDNELRDELRALGVEDTFDAARADLTPMGAGPTGPLYVSQVLHRTYIDVNEEGTRAAAATAVAPADGGAAPTDEPEVREVRLDRPFVYLIVDDRTGTPVLLGTYMGTE